jgi:hypothetical protein
MLWEGKTQSGEIGDPVTMLELISLLRMLARLFRDRRDLMVENLLLRHQLHVALRFHPRPELKTRDRFFWLVIRRLIPDWKQHLILVQPETVVRWHQTGKRRPLRRDHCPAQLVEQQGLFVLAEQTG